MWFRRRKQPRLSLQQQLAARPVPLVQAEAAPDEQGGAKLKVPLRPARWNAWIFRMPKGATKTFELDALGLFVWNLCDGRTSVQQIIRKLAKRYNLNLREAQVPTISFLQTLTKKGLIGMALPQRGESSESDDKQ